MLMLPPMDALVTLSGLALVASSTLPGGSDVYSRRFIWTGTPNSDSYNTRSPLFAPPGGGIGADVDLEARREEKRPADTDILGHDRAVEIGLRREVVQKRRPPDAHRPCDVGQLGLGLLLGLRAELALLLGDEDLVLGAGSEIPHRPTRRVHHPGMVGMRAQRRHQPLHRLRAVPVRLGLHHVQARLQRGQLRK